MAEARGASGVRRRRHHWVRRRREWCAAAASGAALAQIGGRARPANGIPAKRICDYDLGTCDAVIAATAVYANATTPYTTGGCTGRRKAGKLLSVRRIVTPCGKMMKIQTPDAFVPESDT